jgi:putative membrane protein
MVAIDPGGQGRIATAIAEVERRSAAEIVCTLATERHRYVEWLLALAATLAFVVPALLTLAGFGPSAWATLVGIWQAEPLNDLQTVELYVAMQILVLLLATLALWWSPFAQRWTPLSIRQDRVHEAALKQFLARGIHLTEARTGVLIHASLEDHVVEVIADEGIYAKVPPDHWGETADALLTGIRRGDVAGGFVGAIALAGDVLAQHFPPTPENPDELPNRLLIL